MQHTIIIATFVIWPLAFIGINASQVLLRAGSGKAEITPPPGLSTGGHGPNAAVARGHLTRLYARAVLLHDGTSPLLIVSVETFAIPGILPYLIKSKTKEKLGIDIPLENIVVAATHTHQGPANYLSSKVYNANASRIHGYDARMREHLLDQIMRAVTDAAAAAENPGAVSLRLRGGLMDAAWRNRSPKTFMLNPDAAVIMNSLGGRLPVSGAECEKMRLADEPAEEWNVDGCPRLRAVDRNVTALDILKANQKTATLIFAAVHPTVLPADMPLFSSDFTGLAARIIELSEPNYGKDFVVMFLNGAEGDVSARRTRRDLRDVWRHAALFSKVVMTATDRGEVKLDGGIRAAMHLARAGEVSWHGRQTRLAEEASGGAAALGGAEGDRTILYELGWRERTVDDRAANGQGAKLPALKSKLLPLPDLTKLLLAKPSDFPLRLPLSLVRIGSIDVAVTPTEMSTATGFHIRARLRAEGRHVLLIGLANEYASYTATAAEYARQDYMGASTLWGPHEAQFFEDTLAGLASEHNFSLTHGIQDRRGSNGRFRPHDVGQARLMVDEELDLVLRDRSGNPVRDLPFVSWSECGAGDPYGDVVNRAVTIVNKNGVTIDDDTRGRLIVLLKETPKDSQSTWIAIWAAPLADTVPSDTVAFVIKRPNGETRRSQEFQTDQARGFRQHLPC